MSSILFKKFLSAHIRSEHFGYPYGAVCLEVILKEGDEHSGGSDNRIVERMSEVSFAVFSHYPDSKPSCLSVAEVRAASYLKILFLSGRSCLYVHGFYLKIGQVS